MGAATLITVWSDYVCPFCYLELPVLERARRELGDRIDIEWRSYELRPEPGPLPDPASGDFRDLWTRAVLPLAETRGLAPRRPPVQPRSALAHQSVEYARAEGRFDAMHSAVFRAYFEEGRDIGDLEELVAIGSSIGLNPEALRFSLGLGEFAPKVAADLELARELGIDSVPVLIVKGSGPASRRGLRLDGAVDFKSLRRAVEQVARAAAHAGSDPRAEAG